MMLTGVSYSDGISASYQYCDDNVHEGGGTNKMYPLLQRCDDVRYNGPMRTIWYEYQSAGPHGAIVNEKYPGVGVVSAIAPGLAVITGGTFTEARGDGPTRSFTYSQVGSQCLHEPEGGATRAITSEPMVLTSRQCSLVIRILMGAPRS